MVQSVVVRGVRIMVISGSLPVLSFGQTPQTLKMGRSFGFPDTVPLGVNPLVVQRTTLEIPHTHTGPMDGAPVID